MEDQKNTRGITGRKIQRDNRTENKDDYKSKGLTRPKTQRDYRSKDTERLQV